MARSPPWRSEVGTMAITLAFLALLIEAMFGYPDRLVRTIGHPVTWMGRFIDNLDGALNRDAMSPAKRRWAGAFALLLLIMVVGAVAAALQYGFLQSPLGTVLLAVAASTLLAQRSLYEHVQRVAAA